jgi:hypothetical protein
MVCFCRLRIGFVVVIALGKKQLAPRTHEVSHGRGGSLWSKSTVNLCSDLVTRLDFGGVLNLTTQLSFRDLMALITTNFS